MERRPQSLPPPMHARRIVAAAEARHTKAQEASSRIQLTHQERIAQLRIELATYDHSITRILKKLREAHAQRNYSGEKRLLKRYSDARREQHKRIAELQRLQKVIARAKNEENATYCDIDHARQALECVNLLYSKGEIEEYVVLGCWKQTQAYYRWLGSAISQIATRVDIPERYHGMIMISESTAGGLNFYFGGDDPPLGEDHGHFATNARRELVYRRLPRHPYGSRNWLTLPT